MADEQNNGHQQVTPASEWRRARQEGYVVTLPSGHVARLRPVALDVLIMSGKIPDLLTPIAARSLWAETDQDAIADQADLATGFTELVNLVIPAAFLEPQVIAEGEPGEGQIALEDIDFADKVAVFQLAIQPADVLRRFRERQAAGVDAVHDGDEDGAETEHAGRNSG